MRRGDPLPWDLRDLRRLVQAGLVTALESLERERDPAAGPRLWATRARARLWAARQAPGQA